MRENCFDTADIVREAMLRQHGSTRAGVDGNLYGVTETGGNTNSTAGGLSETEIFHYLRKIPAALNMNSFENIKRVRICAAPCRARSFSTVAEPSQT